MLTDFATIERSNSRFLMVSYGVGRCSTPLYAIVDTSTGRTVHLGKRKHAVELWNTRYNFARSRSFSN
jgi:hypothetical protein